MPSAPPLSEFLRWSSCKEIALHPLPVLKPTPCRRETSVAYTGRFRAAPAVQLSSSRACDMLRAGAKASPKKSQRATRFALATSSVTVLRGRRAPMPHQLDFRLLGPLEVRNAGRSLALGGRKQRTLLAILLLHANEAVSDDVLSEGLWGERRPEDSADSAPDPRRQSAQAAPGRSPRAACSRLPPARRARGARPRPLRAALRRGARARAGGGCGRARRGACALAGPAARRLRLRRLRPGRDRPPRGVAPWRDRATDRGRPCAGQARRAGLRAGGARRRAPLARAPA